MNVMSFALNLIHAKVSRALAITLIHRRLRPARAGCFSNFQTAQQRKIDFEESLTQFQPPPRRTALFELSCGPGITLF
jgi:hypothetical protein